MPIFIAIYIRGVWKCQLRPLKTRRHHVIWGKISRSATYTQWHDDMMSPCHDIWGKISRSATYTQGHDDMMSPCHVIWGKISRSATYYKFKNTTISYIVHAMSWCIHCLWPIIISVFLTSCSLSSQTNYSFVPSISDLGYYTTKSNRGTHRSQNHSLR